MSRDIFIELISIGQELIRGERVNSHVRWLSQVLWKQGIQVTRHTTVSDSIGDIQEALLAALKRVDLILLTGGLGDTPDDVTRQALLNLPCTSVSKPLSNRLGSAVPLCLSIGSKKIWALPGPSIEMQTIFVEQVLVQLIELSPKKVSHSMTISIAFHREVELIGWMKLMQQRYPWLEWGVYPRLNFLSLVLRGDRSLHEVEHEIQQKFATFWFPDPRIEEALVRILEERHLTLALAESCSGGLIASRLASLPGVSAVFLGGIVAYSNQLKIDLLKVSIPLLRDKGAVSEACVAAMLEGLFALTSCDVAIGVSGIAGPTGATAHSPVGTVVVGIAKRGDWAVIRRFQAPVQERSEISAWSAETALLGLWRKLAHPDRDVYR